MWLESFFLFKHRRAQSIQSCFSSSSSLYTAASTISVHSSFRRSSIILALAASILRMLRRKCARSDELAVFRSLLRSRDPLAGTLDTVLASTGDAGHSHASGGCQASPFLVLMATGNPFGLSWISSRRICLVILSWICDLATGKSKVSELGDLDQLDEPIV